MLGSGACLMLPQSHTLIHESAHSHAQAAFVLAAICDGHPKGQGLAAASNLLAVLLKWLRTMFPPHVRTPSTADVLPACVPACLPS